MKVDRSKLGWFLKNIRRKSPELSDEELINELANWMEVNPGCIDNEGVSHPGRFSYSTVGYGVFSLFGERYRMGRIEIFDSEDESGYAVSEGSYSMPFVAANQFENFIESLETDLPINIEIGSHGWCESECARDLGFESVEQMKDPEKVKEYRQKKSDEWAREQGYKDYDDLLANSKFGDLRLKTKKDEQ
jgi:hypothetical protein